MATRMCQWPNFCSIPLRIMILGSIIGFWGPRNRFKMYSAKSTSRAARHDVKLRSYNSAQPTSECAHDQTPLLRFVVDLLRSKSTANLRNGV